MGLEPTTFGTTIRRSNQLSYVHRFTARFFRTACKFNTLFDYCKIFAADSSRKRGAVRLLLVFSRCPQGDLFGTGRFAGLPFSGRRRPDKFAGQRTLMEKRARKFGVNRRALLVTAGIVWIVAGANILRIGVVTWASQAHYGLFRAGEAIVVFLLFFNLVFKRLFYKHTQRIERKGDRNCPFSFFDAKGWIVMCFMILFGVLARACHWLPETFIAVFYTGLSAALIVTGVLFLRYWYRNKGRL